MHLAGCDPLNLSQVQGNVGLQIPYPKHMLLHPTPRPFDDIAESITVPKCYFTLLKRRKR